MSTPRSRRGTTRWLRAAAHAALARPRVNRVVTSAVRAGLDATGGAPEWVVPRMRRLGVVRRRLPNGRTLHLRAGADDVLPNRVFWQGWDAWEPETVRPFFRLAAHSRLTLDVGAHVGLFSLLAHHANPGADVVAFEPLPELTRRLTQNVRLNGPGAERAVRVVAAAAAARDGRAELHHGGAASIPFGQASLDPGAPLPGHVTTSMEVALVSVDAELARLGLTGVRLAKVDAEGTEPAVLQGMRETLARDRPDLIVEILPRTGTAGRVEEELRPLGYRPFLLSGAGPLVRASVEPDPRWRNWLFRAAQAGGAATSLGRPRRATK